MSDRLTDEAAIRALMDRYGATVDERDWDGFAVLFTDPLATDFSGIDPAFAPATVARADHVAGTRAVLAQFDATQHMITNVQIALDGERARCRAVMRAEHWLSGLRGAPRYTLFGVYENEFVRESGGWRIARLALRVTREEGNVDVWAAALRRAGAAGGG
ncbi:MAG: nuclear transport factor 2 family protein [Gammaproteobacteria bacterium]